MSDPVSGFSASSYTIPPPFAAGHSADVQRAGTGIEVRPSKEGAARTRAAKKALGRSEEEQRQLAALKRRDREVRAHEAAHLAAAGSLAQGGPHFEFTTGPDGKQYAVGGEVQIDTSPVKGDPEATLRKAGRIQAAANAPADPSPQDRRVAAKAAAMAARARAELAKRKNEADGRDVERAPGTPTPYRSDAGRTLGALIDLFA